MKLITRDVTRVPWHVRFLHYLRAQVALAMTTLTTLGAENGLVRARLLTAACTAQGRMKRFDDVRRDRLAGSLGGWPWPWERVCLFSLPCSAEPARDTSMTDMDGGSGRCDSPPPALPSSCIRSACPALRQQRGTVASLCSFVPDNALTFQGQQQIGNRVMRGGVQHVQRHKGPQEFFRAGGGAAGAGSRASQSFCPVLVC
jgi:hypothetical protein